LTGCKRQPASEPNTARAGGPGESGPANERSDVSVEPPAGSKISLNDVIRAARTWDPSFTSWYGKPAPDFTLIDIKGKEHTLNNYAGKDVVLVFWATYCGACRMEMPHLNELYNADAGDKPVILAVSRESVGLLTRYVTSEKISFPVISNTTTLPMPYSLVQYVPSTFFIDRQGKIKLAAIGMVPAHEMKAIFQAG
jgi:peroxiredoxin